MLFRSDLPVALPHGVLLRARAGTRRAVRAPTRAGARAQASCCLRRRRAPEVDVVRHEDLKQSSGTPDRKSTRLNSSHPSISYAVFCLKNPATSDIYTLSLHDALPI